MILTEQEKNVKMYGCVGAVQNFELANIQNFGDGHEVSRTMSSELAVLAKDWLTKDVMTKPQSRNRKKCPPLAGGGRN